MNQELALHTLKQLHQAGMREVCVCPGARNAAWIEILARDDSPFKAHYFFEERSAAFFALGRIRATERPVAVITTSGTAAGELLPATMEAHYSGLPLILMTADRPRRFRGSGAPQAAEQVGLYGQYTQACLDLEASERPAIELRDRNRPLQINVCFEEPKPGAPLTPLGIWEDRPPSGQAPTQPKALSQSELLGASRFPLVVVAALEPSERSLVKDWLLRLGAPVYLESLSGLRESAELDSLRLHNADKIFARARTLGYPIDRVLRIGAIPTHRLWRDLEEVAAQVEVVSVSRLPFSGLGKKSTLHVGALSALLAPSQLTAQNHFKDAAQELLSNDIKRESSLIELLKSEPTSEPGLVHALSRHIPDESLIYLGNSLPIREWDLAADRQDRQHRFAATRGLNGIDGQISTFLGLCRPRASNWAILGDLTALYDLAGPWILSHLPETRATIAIINNSGGKIFDRMFKHAEFQNHHQLRFAGVAELWKLEYLASASVPPHLNPAQSRILELLPDPEATRRFWKSYEGLS